MERESQNFGDIFDGADVENGHSEEFFAAGAVAILGGLIHIQKGKRLLVEDPHGIRTLGDNQVQFVNRKAFLSI